MAGALGSIVALAVTVHGLFDRPSKPEGTVAMKVLSTTPLTYGGWMTHERVPTQGVPVADRRTPGRLIAYDVTTH